MSDKPVVRDFDHQVAPGVDAHTHEETKTGKNTYEHKSETGFEGPNVTGSAYEKTKVTLAEDKSKHASSGTHGTSAATSGSHTSSHSSSQHAASHTSSSSQHQQSSALDTRHHDKSSSVTGADGKPIVRDYDYQVAPGVAAHTHEELKTGKNTYEHKAETGFEGPNVVGSAYEKTTVKMSGGDKHAASGSHHSSEHGGHHAHFEQQGQQQHATSGGSTSSSSSTHTELDSRQQHTTAAHGATTASSAGTVSTKPIERDYDYQPAPGVQAHTHEVIKQGTNTYEHKAETTFEGPNTTGSAYEKTTVKMSGPKHT